MKQIFLIFGCVPPRAPFPDDILAFGQESTVSLDRAENGGWHKDVPQPRMKLVPLARQPKDFNSFHLVRNTVCFQFWLEILLEGNFCVYNAFPERRISFFRAQSILK